MNSPADIPSFGYDARDFVRLPFTFEMAPLRAGGRGFAHRHAYHHLLWIAGGEGMHQLDETRHHFGPGWAFLVAPQQVHHWVAHVPVQGYTVKFSRDFLTRAGGLLPAGVAVLDGPGRAEVQAQLDALMAESAAAHADRDELLAVRLRLLLLTLRRLAPPPAPAPAGDDLASRFARLMPLHRGARPADFAALLGTTPARLNGAVKRATGRTVAQQLREQLLLEAKRRLMFGGEPVADLAVALGFDDPAYFGRFFKQHTRMTPGDYRRSHRQKVPAPR